MWRERSDICGSQMTVRTATANPVRSKGFTSGTGIALLAHRMYPGHVEGKRNRP